MKTKQKQPSENLDYDFDYSDWIPDGDTIVSAVVTSDSGLTLGATTVNTAEHKVKQWISGGTNGSSYVVTCKATTAGGRIKEKEFRLTVAEIA